MSLKKLSIFRPTFLFIATGFLGVKVPPLVKERVNSSISFFVIFNIFSSYCSFTVRLLFVYCSFTVTSPSGISRESLITLVINDREQCSKPCILFFECFFFNQLVDFALNSREGVALFHIVFVVHQVFSDVPIRPEELPPPNMDVAFLHSLFRPDCISDDVEEDPKLRHVRPYLVTEDFSRHQKCAAHVITLV